MTRGTMLFSLLCWISACSFMAFCFANTHHAAHSAVSRLHSLETGNGNPMHKNAHKSEGSRNLLRIYGGSDSAEAGIAETLAVRTKNPLPQKNLFSKLTFTWVKDLMRLGNKRPLQMADLWQLDPSIEVANVSEIFTEYLRIERKQTSHKNAAIAASGNILVDYWTSPITRAVVKMFRKEFVLCGVLKFFNTLVQFTPSLLISRILKHLSDANPTTAPAMKVFGLPLLLMVSLCTKTVTENQYFDNTIQLGLKVKSALSSTIYQKSLVLSPAGKLNHTMGEIVNYLQIDANKMEYVAGSIHVLWDSFFQVCGYLTLLMQFLGPSVFGGLAIMLLIIPINTYYLKRLSEYRASVLKLTDSRVRVTNEVLQGARAIKSYNWEKPFMEQLMQLRSTEIDALKLSASVRAILMAILSAAPSFVATVTLSTYALLGNELTPAKVFTALALFNQLRFPVIFLPMFVNTLSEGIISLRRLDNFLAAEEVENYVEDISANENMAIEIDGDFSWSDQLEDSAEKISNETVETSARSAAALPRGSLRDIQMKVRKGELVAIVGPVGSGKSTLVASLLGDLHKVRGKVAVSGSVAYVPQTSWIPNDSLRNVITFGNQMEEGRYAETLRVCGLETDLALLDDGDLTEIGERGVNLSGGQKQRLSLARAVYDDADVYIFDDPLSALDSEVGSSVFRDCIKGQLKGKTRLLVTHKLKVLPEVDKIVIMNVTESGISYVLDQGSFSELQERGHDLEKLVEEVDVADVHSDSASAAPSTAVSHKGVVGVEVICNSTASPSNMTVAINVAPLCIDDSDSIEEVVSDKVLEHHVFDEEVDDEPSHVMSPVAHDVVCLTPESTTPPVVGVHTGDHVSDAYNGSIAVAEAVAVGSGAEAKAGEEIAGDKKSPVKLIVAEERAEGVIKVGTYQQYLRAGKRPLLLVLAALALITSNGSVVLQQWIVGAWTSDVGYVKRPLAVYLAGICLCAVSTATFTWTRTYLGVMFGAAASLSVHNNMIKQVLRAPLSFFESTPVGRLVQRFSKDLDNIDSDLPNAMQQFLAVCINMGGNLLSMSLATPRFTIVIAPLFAIYVKTTNYYRNVARELKRLDSLSRSPVYSHFGETLGGLNIIRSFKKQAIYRRANELKIDDSMSAFFALKSVDRWLSFRLELLGNAIVFFSALFSMTRTSQAGRAGIALSQALGITSLLNWAVRQGTEMESHMNSVERVMHTTHQTPSERSLGVDDAAAVGMVSKVQTQLDIDIMNRNISSDASFSDSDLAQSGWPWKGGISLRGVRMRYRHDMEPVLQDVTFDVQPGESVGIVGRTGSGKSSLFRALLRLTETEAGSMSIDGMDTSTMNLDTLRSALSIIPQEPMFFSGSIARNIDPFGTRSEEELWVALRKAGVSGTVAALPGGLNFTLSENGDNFSAGQKQQLCLARALVRQSRILFLDEATSSVDSDTDALIQRTIRTEFGDGNCTTLTIAHRLDSIADCDRILVMDAGRVVEFDSPARLLMNPQSLYSRLVQADRVSRKDVSAEATGTANARATSTSPKAGKKDQQNPKRGYMPASR